jgi:hypothetical protein
VYNNKSKLNQQLGDTKMKNYRVTVKGESGSIHDDNMMTERTALSLGKKIANEAFYGEECEIKVELLGCEE